MDNIYHDLRSNLIQQYAPDFACNGFLGVCIVVENVRDRFSSIKSDDWC